ncbi:MAG TPA: NB-ARC domain-containing protein, partial [Chloroflexota bacterium]|nr:NB-ARC domain-containing protein [Chloroflexota bacterium]
MGREAELAEVTSRLATTQLLTLTGAGGCGKTRLALEVARGLIGHFPDGVWLVELAPLSDPALVPQAVAAVLGVSDVPGQPLTTTLREALRPKRLLLVLDNCEHVVADAAALVDALLRVCPQLRILATSREVLGVPGEVPWRVPSLGLPELLAKRPVQALVQSEAVRLFVDRAMTVQPHFRVTERNALTVARLCHRLDGIPLAIELAAARARVLSVEQVLVRLDDRFRLLTGGSRMAPARQQSLRATVEWSYGLLPPAERRLFERLAV